jgi:hypothetical protein
MALLNKAIKFSGILLPPQDDKKVIYPNPHPPSKKHSYQ